MKVAFVQPTADRMGHYATYSINLCQALAKSGHAVTLIANVVQLQNYLPEPPRFSCLEVGHGHLTFAEYEGRTGRILSPATYAYARNSFLVVRAGLAFARRERCDVVHISGGEYQICALLAAIHRRAGIPVIVEVSAANFSYTTYVGSRSLKVYKAWQAWIFRSTLGRGISALSVLGEHLKRDVSAQLQLHPDFPVAVVPIGGHAGGARIAPAAAREKLQLPAGVPIFLFFGLIRREKGLRTLLEAAARLSHSGFHLVIAGHPKDHDANEIRTWVRDSKLGDRVSLHLRYIPEAEVATYFFACDALILPYSSAYVGGSGPLLTQACVHGVPVICTDVGEMEHLVCHHGLGLVAPADDAGALAGVMQAFLNLSASERGRMSENAVRLSQSHGYEQMAEKFGELYELVRR